MKSKSNLAFQSNVLKNISETHLLKEQYCKSIGITPRQLQHLIHDDNITLAKLDDFAERAGFDPWDLIKPSAEK